MMERPDRPALDAQQLARYFRVLSVPSRIDLLRTLQLPHAMRDIELRPVRRRGDLPAQRALSREAVREHVERLQEIGLVMSVPGPQGGRQVKEYVVNHVRLFLLVEELRQLSLLRAARGHVPEATASGGRPGLPAEMPSGPSMVLVSGPLEGTSFPLSGKGPWLLGRAEGLAVSLPLDPFVSKHNTRVVARDGGFHVENLPDARNGTELNWRPLPHEGSSPLRSGDIVGVGRSLLVFRGG